MSQAPQAEATGNVATLEQTSSGFKDAIKGGAKIDIGDEVNRQFDGLPQGERRRLEDGVLSLIKYLVDKDPSLVGKDALGTIDAVIDVLDTALEKQINLVLHHESFQKLEATWRGLNFLVSNTLTSTQLKIKVMDLNKEELSDMMEEFEGVTFDQSPLFKTVFDRGIGSANGEIFGSLVGDYYFDHSARDVMTLKGISKLAATAHCPFIAGASPSAFGMKSWTSINDPPQLASLMDNDFYAPWRGLRASEDSRYIGLAMPRFITRYPYGPDTVPVKEFRFSEDTAKGDHSRYTWSNAAYAMGTAINRAFTYDGYCGRIRGYHSGGRIRGLPMHTFKSEKSGIQTKCPAEIEIPQRREAELASLGFMPLIHFEGTDDAVFVGAQSLQSPKEYEGIDGAMATANAALSARLPYLFVACRFAHFLKRILYKNVGLYADKNELQRKLNEWIRSNYVEQKPDASQDERAKRPLRDAKVTVVDDESKPGYYGVNFKLCPHIQVEGISVMLNLVSKIPSK